MCLCFALKGTLNPYFNYLSQFLSCQLLAAPQNISPTRTGNPIHDPHGMINFSNRGVTGFWGEFLPWVEFAPVSGQTYLSAYMFNRGEISCSTEVKLTPGVIRHDFNVTKFYFTPP